MKTIAQQLNIKEFPFEIKDSKSNLIYFEDSNGNWYKKEYDSNNNIIYFETSIGYWTKRQYDSRGNVIYYETSNCYWYKSEYDSNNNIIYYENSDGVITSNRPKDTPEYTMEELTKLIGKEFKIKK